LPSAAAGKNPAARHGFPRRFMKLARLRRLAFASALFGAACAAVHPADPTERGSLALKLRLPGLASPLVDIFPKPDGAPAEPVKAAVFAKINHDRTTAGRLPVAWDEGASRVADAFCRQQVREATNGHFLMDGVPPYARTSFSGVFGAQSENSVS